MKFTAKPFTDKTMKYDKMFFFDPMNMKFPGEYRWVRFTSGSPRLGMNINISLVMCMSFLYTKGEGVNHTGGQESPPCLCIAENVGILIYYANSNREGLPSLDNVRGVFPQEGIY